MVLLSQQAVNDHLDSAPAFIQQIAIQRRQMLAQAEYTHLASVTTVSPEEVSQYYLAHQAEFDSADVREVVVRKKLEGAKEGTPGLAAPEARARAESIRKALTAGTDIKKVAQDFQAPNDVMIDLEPRHIRRGQLLASMDKAAFELKDGELSQPLEIPQAFVLIQAVGYHHSELKEASPGIEKTLRQQKLDTAVAELKKKATVWMDEEYFKPPQAPLTLTTVPSVDNRAPKP
jgi:parvulin-like peptidyl-prolyl isomerase